MKFYIPFILLFISIKSFSQTDQKIYDIINAVSSDRIEKDVRTLANFGTRNTFSDTLFHKRRNYKHQCNTDIERREKQPMQLMIFRGL